jgi:hypothetical protein
MEEPQARNAPSDSDHYREMGRKLRILACELRLRDARQGLLDLALRYEQRADSLDARSVAGLERDHR